MSRSGTLSLKLSYINEWPKGLAVITPDLNLPGLYEHRENATDWIAGALAHHPEYHEISLGGIRIAYRTWGSISGKDILFVHGGAAHSGWWDHIAPLFSAKGRVAALDLSGHGDSGHRAAYSMEQWSDEVLAVQDAAGLSRNCVVVGHSLGGLITLNLREQRGLGIDKAIVIDSPVGGPDANKLPEASVFTSKRRTYPSKEAAMERFRPVPSQPVIGGILRHIAEGSLRESNGTWGWKFDEKLFDGMARMWTTIPGPSGRLAYLRSENGLVEPQVQEKINNAGGIFLELPGAGHAPMLDQPAALVASIRAIISGWDTTEPTGVQRDSTASVSHC